VNILRKTVAIGTTLLLLFTLVLWTSSPVNANATRTATVDVSVLNVRSGPGTGHTKISEVTLGTVLPVIAEQSGWVNVTLKNGQSGWISSTYVTLKNISTPISSPTLSARVTTDILNVRSGPGTEHARLTTVTKNTVLPVLKNQNDWLQVQLPSGDIGWIAGEYCLLLESPAVGNTPPINNSPPPVSNIPSTPTPIEVSTTAVVNIELLIVRSGPSPDFQIVTTVTKNTQLPVIKQQGNWLNVTLPNGQTGWVFATYAPIVSQQSPPITTPPVSDQNTVVQRLATVNVSALNARLSPNTDSERLALLPKGATLPVVGEQDDWLQVRLLSGETAWIASWFVDISTMELPATPSNPGGSTNIEWVSNPTQAPSSVLGKIIVIDPGHGGSNSGAIGITGLYEKVVTLDVSLRLAHKLRQAGAIVVMTRDNDTTLSLNDRVIKAQAAGAHAFVSVHANAHPNRSVSGTETYYYRGRAGDVESYYLAAHLQTELVKALGLRDIGVKHGNFHVIRETRMPAALVELAFLSNAYDESLLKTDAFREKSAVAIFRGLETFFSY
jgi:N-acetylmuramoyl-L-alanine amidase